MKYKVMVANGDRLIDKFIDEVHKVIEGDNVYFFYDNSMRVIFSAPFDSVVFISLA
ncbi:hypothetical protein [Sporosarcina sp. FA9]|uniref:hypothetical protein n=1 Tax=Sporosarcina sp. FA9 TaxID=3413030 RepID=UPI003F65505E